MPIISMGHLRMGESADRGFSLPTPRDYRGRVGSAIPSGGIILKAARGGTAPVTHTVSGLPSGLAFNTGTRTITGDPIAVHATREVTLTATDSSTPAQVVTATFQFPVVGRTAALTRDDFDHRGYGLSTRTTYLLALLQSTVAVGSGNVTVWRRPPDGANIGLLLDDDGNTISDLTEMTFAAAGEIIPVTRMTFFVSQDRVELRKSVSGHFGTFINSTLNAPQMTLQIGTESNTINYERGFTANAQWRRSSPDLGAFLQTFDSGVRMLFAVSSP